MSPSYNWLWALLPVPLALYLLTREEPARTVLLTGLATAPFPGANGDALVHVPAGVGDGPTEVVAYLHGWNGCIASVAGTVPTACTPGGVVHQPSDILGQFERSGRRAVLIVPELRFDAESGDPGQFGHQNGFASFLEEVRARMGLGPIAGATLYAHSGGYQAAAAILERGGVPVRGVALLDALYGDVPTFVRAATAGRFVSLYTAAGGTAANNQALAARVDAVGRLPWSGRPVVARVDVPHGRVPGFVEALLGSV